MDSPTPPPAPDYSAAAKETAAGNLQMAKYATQANRVNQFTPLGSLTYSKTQNFDQQGYDNAMQAYKASRTAGTAGTAPTRTWVPGSSGESDYGGSSDGYWLETPGTAGTAGGTKLNAPNRNDFMMDQWTQTQTLTPEAQATLDKQMALSNQYADVAQTGMNRARSVLEDPTLNTAGLPQLQGLNLDGAPQVRGLDASGLAGVQGLDLGALGGVRGLDAGGLRDVRGLSLDGAPQVRGLDASGLLDLRQLSQDGLPQGAINAGTTAQQAIMSRLQPTLARDEEALRARMANQGITLGSEAYNREMELAGQRRNDLTMQAALQGIGLDQAARQQAFGERQAMVQADMAARQQGFGERQAMSAFDAARRQQAFGEQQAMVQADMAARQQGFGERQAMSGFDAARRQQGLSEQQARMASQLGLFQAGMGAQQAQAQNEAERRRQMLGEQQAMYGANADLRGRMLQEQAMMQDRPLNLINALRTGAQVQQPTFQPYAQQATTQGPNMLGAAQAQYSADMDAYNASQAQDAGLMQGLFSLGGAAMGSPWLGSTLGGLFGGGRKGP